MTTLDLMGLAILFVGIYFIFKLRAHYGRKDEAFNKGYETGIVMLESAGFDAVMSAASKMPKGPYRNGICQALIEKEGPECRRTFKKK